MRLQLTAAVLFAGLVIPTPGFCEVLFYENVFLPTIGLPFHVKMLMGIKVEPSELANGPGGGGGGVHWLPRLQLTINDVDKTKPFSFAWDSFTPGWPSDAWIWKLLIRPQQIS